MKQLMFASLGLVLMASSLAQNSNRIYRCGNEYTNNAAQAQARDCKLVEGGNITVVEGTRVNSGAGGTAAPVRVAAAPPTGGAPARVDSSEQRARDADRRTILEAELRKAESRQAELLKEYNNGEPEKTGIESRNYQRYLDRVAEMKASLARNDADIAGLKRELSNLGAAR